MTEDFRRFPKSESRQIIDYNRFMELTGEKVLLCLDRGIMEIARYFLNSRGSWRTTYVKEYVGYVGYVMPTEEEFENILQAIAEANIDMSSCDEIVTRLEAIATAIQNRPCCGSTSGSRGSGTSQDAPNPYDQDETPTEPPPGFEDMGQYQSHKCNQAQDILNNLKSDLFGLSGITYAAQSPTGLVGAIILFLLTPVPFDDLVALAGYLIYTGYNYSFLATIAGEIDNENDNLLCTLYNAPSAAQAKADFLAEIEAISSATFPNPVDASWTTEAVEYMLTYDSINRLFEPTPTTSQSADCSSCGPECVPLATQPTITYGTVVDFTDGVLEVSSEFVDGWDCGVNAQEVAITSTPGGFFLGSYEIVSGSITKCGESMIYNAYEGLSTPYEEPVGRSDTGFGLNQNLGSLYVISSTPFTIRFTLCEMV